MRANRVARPSTIVIVVALATALFACGGDDDNASSEQTGAVTNPDSATPELSAPEAPTSVAPGTTVPSTTEPTPSSSPVTSVPNDPVCGPFGPLVTHDLNDRCEPPAEPLGPAFAASNIPWRDASCPNMIAVPGELVVVVASGVDLENAVTAVGGLLPVTDSEVITEDSAALLRLDPSVALTDVVATFPALQDVGRSVDFNYLEPLQPNNAFRPYDDPLQAGVPPPPDFGGGQDTDVVVIDSPDNLGIYDVGGNGFVDEDNGHGVFVKSLIERSGANVTLVGVGPPNSARTPPDPSLLASGRWAPMAISDSDIIVALGSVTDKVDVVNLSLGGVGCPANIGERLALARAMDNLLVNVGPVVFVAAAGNGGVDQPHFPAAWRDENVTSGLLGVVDASVANEVLQMHDDLIGAIYAVGSVEEDGTTPSSYSNCGKWVNAVAFGTLQVGEYPASPTGYATWSGTSFATANFTAAFVTGLVAGSQAVEQTGARQVAELEPCPPPQETPPNTAPAGQATTTSTVTAVNTSTSTSSTSTTTSSTTTTAP